MDSDDEMGMDEAFLDADETGIAVSDETELSEVGRVRSDLTNNRFQPY